MVFVKCPKCQKANECQTQLTAGVIATNEKFYEEVMEVTCSHCSHEFVAQKDSVLGGIKYTK